MMTNISIKTSVSYLIGCVSLMGLIVFTSSVFAGTTKIVSDATWKSIDLVQDPGACPSVPGQAAPDWTAGAFDDSSWRNAYVPYPWIIAGPLPGSEMIWDWPFGGTPTGANGPVQAFFRRIFTLNAPAISAQAEFVIDDEMQFYVNGTLVVEDLSGGVNDYLGPVDIAPYLRVGENVIAIRAWDGSFCNVFDRIYEKLSVVVTIVTPEVVSIDIKPGSDPNSINLGSAGVVPVAILSSSEFDATTVDPDTVTLAGAAVKLVGNGKKSLCHVEDVNADTLPDLVCGIETAQFLIEPGQSTAVLEAQTYSGLLIRGEDSIRIVPEQ